MQASIKNIGIVGGGKMGSNIFFFLLSFDYNLIWYTKSDIDKKQKKLERKLSRIEISNNYKRIITENFSDIAKADLVIECVSESVEIKKDVLFALCNVLKENAIIATNTSSIPIEKLFTRTKRDSKIIGAHFFYPLEIKTHAEIISTEITDVNTITEVKYFLNNIGKEYLHQNNKSAFSLNRIMLTIQNEACRLLQSYTKEQIDEVFQEYFGNIGIFNMMRQIGHQLLYTSVNNYNLFFGDDAEFLINYLKKKIDDKESLNKSDNNRILKKDEIKIILDSIKNSYIYKLDYICKISGYSSEIINRAMYDYLGTNPELWNFKQDND